MVWHDFHCQFHIKPLDGRYTQQKDASLLPIRKVLEAYGCWVNGIFIHTLLSPSNLCIAALTLSAIYISLWSPDIWSSARTQVKVNAQDDPWLAGMPDKSQASACRPGSTFPPSIAPQNSPTPVKEIPLIPGSHLTFKVQESKTTTLDLDNPRRYFGPEGNIEDLVTHTKKAENGISNIQAQPELTGNALKGMA